MVGRIVALLIASASMLVALELILEGPFLWHFSRTTAIVGWMEVLALGGALYLVLGRTGESRWRLLWLALPVAFYLRRHHVDGPFLVAVLYLEFLLALGTAAGALCGAWSRGEPAHGAWSDRLLFGLALWSLGLWSLQVGGLGEPVTARILLAAAAIPVFFAARAPPLILALARTAFATRGAARIAAAGGIAFLCALFARTNRYAGHDALWYGFRPEQVLVGNASVFDQIGMVSPVYYFPKFYEVLLLPLSAMGDFSFVGGFTILLAGLLSLLVLKLLRLHAVPAPFAAIVALAVLTMPALANTALSPKPDVIAALAVLAMAWQLHAMRVPANAARNFGFLLGWAAVAALSKLNLLPYVAALGTAALLALVLHAQAGRRIQVAQAHPALPMVLAMTLVGAAVTARTWNLAGMPTVAPEQLVAVWSFAGLELGPTAGTLDWVYPQQWGDVPVLLLDWLLRPARLPHIVISWCGNAWFVLGVTACIAAWRGVPAPPGAAARWPEWLIAATGLLLLIGVQYHYRGSDGNYFIAPVASAWILAAAGVCRHMPDIVRNRLVAAALGFAVLFQGYYAFVSGGWGIPGTRSLDLALLRSVWDTEERRTEQLERAGLGRIGAFLRNGTPADWRIVGDVPEPQGFWLAARYESLATISFSRPEFVETAEGFRRLLGCGRVDAIIVASDGSGRAASLLRAADLRAKTLVSDPEYVLMDLREAVAGLQCG